MYSHSSHDRSKHVLRWVERSEGDQKKKDRQMDIDTTVNEIYFTHLFIFNSWLKSGECPGLWIGERERERGSWDGYQSRFWSVLRWGLWKWYIGISLLAMYVGLIYLVIASTFMSFIDRKAVSCRITFVVRAWSLQYVPKYDERLRSTLKYLISTPSSPEAQLQALKISDVGSWSELELYKFSYFILLNL